MRCAIRIHDILPREAHDGPREFLQDAVLLDEQGLALGRDRPAHDDGLARDGRDSGRFDEAHRLNQVERARRQTGCINGDVESLRGAMAGVVKSDVDRPFTAGCRSIGGRHDRPSMPGIVLRHAAGHSDIRSSATADRMVDGFPVEFERKREHAQGPPLQPQPLAAVHPGAVDAEGGQFLVAHHQTDRPTLRVPVVGHQQHGRTRGGRRPDGHTPLCTRRGGRRGLRCRRRGLGSH